MSDYNGDQSVAVVLATAQRVRLVIDEENGAPDFWNAVDTLEPPDPDAALLREMDIARPMDVTVEQARRILAWAETLPEWNDGAQFAPHPILFQDADEVQP